MKLMTIAGVLVALAGASALARVQAPAGDGAIGGRAGARAAAGPVEPAQGRQERREPERRPGGPIVVGGRGAEIGVRIVGSPTSGVVIDDVQPDSPAEKAGLKRGDVIVEFDGERVRSVRQLSRLILETTPGRTVDAVLVRDGQRQDVRITPAEGRGGSARIDLDRLEGLAGELGHLGDHLPPFDFNFEFELPGGQSGRRLGLTVNELTDQLAQYFGAKDGLLVASVTEGSAVSRAGLKAGDVITSINGQSVRSRDDLIRSVRAADNDELIIVFVRDRKESTVKATIDPPRRTRRD